MQTYAESELILALTAAGFSPSHAQRIEAALPVVRRNNLGVAQAIVVDGEDFAAGGPGGTVFGPTAERWLQEFGDISNPLADHSDVFEAAFAAQAISRFELRIPVGIFNYSRGMTPKGGVRGCGADRDVFGIAAYGTILRKQTALGAGAQWLWQNVDGFTVADMRFESPNAIENGDNIEGTIFGSHAAMFERVEHANATNLVFIKGAYGSLMLQRVRHITCYGLISYSTNKDAFHLTNGGGLTTDFGVTRDIKYISCLVIMPGDDAYPAIGYWESGVNEQPIIEDVAHINCVVQGMKRAHAFRPTGVRGYRSIGCSVLGPPATYPYSQGPTGVTFGCNSPISLSNGGFPCWASSNVEFDGFYVDGLVWAGAQRALVHAYNNDGFGIQRNIRIRGRSANTTPSNGILIEAGANGGGCQDADIEWVHEGDVSSIGIRLVGGTNNRIKFKCARTGAQAIYVFNGAKGKADLDFEAEDTCYQGVEDIMNFGEGSGTFLLKHLDLSLKITNQVSPVERLGESLTSANAGTCSIGRFRPEINFPTMTTSDTIVGSFLTQTVGQTAYGTLTSPAILPLPNTAALTLSAATVGSARTATADKAVFNPADEGKVIRGSNGVAGASIITGWNNSKSVTVDNTVAWDSVGPHPAESWVHSALVPATELAYWRAYRVYTIGATSPSVQKGPHPDIHNAALAFADTGILNGVVLCAPGEALRVSWSGGTAPTVANAYVSRE